MAAANQAHPGSGYQPRRGKGSPKAPPRKPNGAALPLLGREMILAADDLATERVPVPEWGGDVLVRALPLADIGVFETTAGDEDRSNVEVMTRIVALCACDADGNRMFSLEDAAALACKARAPLMRLAEAAIRVNGMTAGDVEDLAKN